MASENKAPDRIWLGRDNRYVGSPWLRLASDFDDEDEDGEVQEYVRADLYAAQAAEIARLTAERDAALAGARKAHDALWELNTNNYDHDEVCKLNDGAIEAILTLAPLIGETHGYSPEWWNQRAALQPDPDARQADLAKAWMMGREDAAGAAKHAGLAFGYERAVQAIRALTPPADLAAKIGGE